MYRDEAAKCAGAGASPAGCALLASGSRPHGYDKMLLAGCCRLHQKTRAKVFSTHWGVGTIPVLAGGRDLQ